MPKRILITGASGFIGGYLVKEALDQGFEVWAGIRTGSPRRHLSDPRIHCIDLDYSSIDILSTQIRALTPEGEPAWHYVIHNAGVTKTVHKEDFYLVNGTYAGNLFSTLASSPIPPRRVVLMSSLSTYGSPTVEGRSMRADDPQRPNTHYGHSKLRGEQALKASGLPYSIMLLTGVYGPGDADYLMAIKGINKGLNPMAGLTPQEITFVYASDVAKAAFFVLTHPEAEGQSYMLTDGEVYRDIDFGLIVQRLLGRKKVLHLRVPLPILYLSCKIGDMVGKITGKVTPLNSDKYRIFAQRSWACDDSPIRSLGFEPEISLTEGVRRTIEEARKANKL